MSRPLTDRQFSLDELLRFLYDFAQDVEDHPEQMLLCAVIARALMDLRWQKRATYPSPRQEEKADTAMEWRRSAERFFGTDRHVPFCRAAGLEPDDVTRWAKKILEAPILV